MCFTLKMYRQHTVSVCTPYKKRKVDSESRNAVSITHVLINNKWLIHSTLYYCLLKNRSHLRTLKRYLLKSLLGLFLATERSLIKFAIVK